MTRMTTGAVTLLAALAAAGAANAQTPPLPQRASEALAFQEGGQIDEAIKAWTDVATGVERMVLQAAVPGDARQIAAEAWFSVGFLGREEPAESIAAYTRAVLLEPAMAKAYYNRGNMKFLQGRYRGALEDYQISADLEEDAHTHYNLGNARLFTGGCRGAVEAYRHAEGLRGAGSIRPYISRNRIYAMIACGDFAEAKKELGELALPNKLGDLSVLEDIISLIGGDSDVPTSYAFNPSTGFVVTVRADAEPREHRMAGTAGNAGSAGSTAVRGARGGEGVAFRVEVAPAGGEDVRDSAR